MNAEGALTADNALNPLAIPDVPDSVTPLVVVPLRSVAVQVVVLIFCINAEGAETADNALNPLTVAEVADTLVLKADVELRSVNLALTPLIAAEDTLVAALMLVADIVGAKADGAETADSALSPLTVAEVADTIVAKAEGADTADNALSPLTVAEVADTLVLSADVELKSVTLALTPLIAAELTLVAALILVADILTTNAEGAETADKALNPLTNPDVPDIVTPRDDVALKSTTLVAAEKLTAPVTVPPDNGK